MEVASPCIIAQGYDGHAVDARQHRLECLADVTGPDDSDFHCDHCTRCYLITR